MSKLVKMCQRCGEDHEKVAWVVRLIYMRLKTEVLDLSISKADFDNKTLKSALEMYDVCEQIPSSFCGRIAVDRDNEWIRSACDDPLCLHSKFRLPEEKAKITSMKGSSKHLVKWILACQSSGSFDPVFQEMFMNCRKMKHAEKVSYDKLVLSVPMIALLDKEEQHAKTTAMLHVAQQKANEPETPIEESDVSDDETIQKAHEQQAAQSKEDAISSALTKHCESIIEDVFVQSIRPCMRSGWEDLVKQNDFIKHRHTTTGKTAWFFDAGSDRDAVAAEKQTPKSAMVMLDHEVAKSFLETAESECLLTENDITCIPDSKKPSDQQGVPQIAQTHIRSRGGVYHHLQA